MVRMHALYISAHGDTDNVVFGERSEPHAGPGEVRLAVKAAALNHLDLFVLRGLPHLDLPLPHVGGADAAGVIDEVGDGVDGWNVGDEVVVNPGRWCGRCEFCRRGEESMCIRYGLLGEHVDGTFAERVVVSAEALAPRPGHLSWPEAAALPLTFLTAWRMLVNRARLTGGETVLIHGIGGGVALAALEIAVRLGARAIVTSSSRDKLDRALQMGAAEAIDYTAGPVARSVRAMTGKRGVDVVVETAGSRTWSDSLRSAAKGGRIVTCGATTGPDPAEEVRLVFWNQLSILGSTMGSLRDWRAMVTAVDQWGSRPVVDTVLPLGRGREAYERMAAGRQFGKIVLRVDASAPGEQNSV